MHCNIWMATVLFIGPKMRAIIWCGNTQSSHFAASIHARTNKSAKIQRFTFILKKPNLYLHLMLCTHNILFIVRIRGAAGSVRRRCRLAHFSLLFSFSTSFLTASRRGRWRRTWWRGRRVTFAVRWARTFRLFTFWRRWAGRGGAIVWAGGWRTRILPLALGLCANPTVRGCFHLFFLEVFIQLLRAGCAMEIFAFARAFVAPVAVLKAFLTSGAFWEGSCDLRFPETNNFLITNQ